MKELVWVTKDGRRIRVCDMETRHINNCINMILRRNGWRREYLPRLELELEIRKLPR